MYKEIFSALAMFITLVVFLPYIMSILRCGIKPHVFSWVIWATTTFIVFVAQLQAGAGIGAWPIGLSALITTLVALLAWRRRGDISITRADWLFFLSALLSLPFWYLTADPLWAVVVLTTVDTLGFAPTIRKTWHQPQSESVLFFLLFVVRNLLVIAALQSYSLTTVLFPAVIAMVCLALISIMLVRRRTVMQST